MNIKVLAVRQPDAWFIANGYKDIENRSWSTKYRGPLAIHASKAKMTRDDKRYLAEVCRDDLGIPVPDITQYGGIVGVVSLVDVVKDSDSPWFYPDPGNNGWVIKNARQVEFIPIKGRLGLFDIDSDLLNGFK